MNNLFQNSNYYQKKAKPFLKWAGGKSQLLNQFELFFPDEVKSGNIVNYYEPFIGGGAVFFHLKNQYNFENSFLSDVNPDLVLLYNIVQTRVLELIDGLGKLESDYLSLNDDSRELYYYTRRDEFNSLQVDYNDTLSENSLRRSILLIYLNKTCFNGLYRVNKKGKFNVPFGDYSNPKILDEENLYNASSLLENSTITKSDFRESLLEIKTNSFIYLDPPYLPISKTSSFTSYSKNDFGIEDQIELAIKIKELASRDDIKIMLSNSDPKSKDPSNDFFESNYSEDGLYIYRVFASRMINSKSEGRGKIPELVITNYKT